MRLALCAGKYLDISVRSEYVETILSKCIDEYKSLRLQQEQGASKSSGIFGAGGDSGADDAATKEIVIDPKMENIIEQMFQRCYRDHCFEQAIGSYMHIHFHFQRIVVNECMTSIHTILVGKFLFLRHISGHEAHR